MYGTAVSILAVVALVALRLNLPVSMLTCDLAVLAHVNPLCGVLSSLGVLLWCATASVSLFVATLAAKRGDKLQAAFLLWFAVLSLVLMLDDLFMFHEYLAAEYLGLRQRYVILAYMALTSGLLVSFRKVILTGDYALLAAAIGLFSFSVAIEKVLSYHKGSWLYLAEDGAKFLGLVSWAGYFIRHSWFLLARSATKDGGDTAGQPVMGQQLDDKNKVRT